MDAARFDAEAGGPSSAGRCQAEGGHTPGPVPHDTGLPSGRPRIGALVDQVVAELGQELPEPVATALRRVPRHLFTPGVPVAGAYEDIYTSIVTKRSERGTSLSSVSAPWIVAGMLAQLDVRPGQSVLEIGSGGYQAALLRELVGPHGSVTTMDIDPEVIARARACLDLAV